MSEVTITVITVLIGAFSLVAKSADHINISPPMVFITIGAIVGVILRAVGENVVGNGTSEEIVLLIAELTLIVVLFHDASTIQLKDLHVGLPLRLLSIGLGITLVAIFFVSWALLPAVGVFGALLIAGALSPTDAGLGAPTILNPKVPSSIRQALNVESGLNDGMCTPVIFIALAGLSNSEGGGGSPDIPKVALIPIAISIALAGGITPIFAKVLDYSAVNHTSTHAGRSIALVMLPMSMWGLSVITGANSFITAFLAGGIFGYFSDLHDKDHALSELLESVADFLSNVAWFLAGELLVDSFTEAGGFHWQWLVIAILALLPLRMIPVYISMIGSGLDFASMSFVGWFGPRGIATVIFALLTLEHTNKEEEGSDDEKIAIITNDIVGTLLVTVVLSVFAHGYSAAPLAEKYAARGKAGSVAESLDADPLIRLRTRGKAYVQSRRPGGLRPSMSMNLDRFVGEFNPAPMPPRRRNSVGEGASGLDGIDMNVPLSGGGGDGDGEDGEFSRKDSSTRIIIPYTKINNTTVLRRASVQFDDSEQTKGVLLLEEDIPDHYSEHSDISGVENNARTFSVHFSSASMHRSEEEGAGEAPGTIQIGDRTFSIVSITGGAGTKKSPSPRRSAQRQDEGEQEGKGELTDKANFPAAVEEKQLPPPPPQQSPQFQPFSSHADEADTADTGMIQLRRSGAV